jgi:hypothetical protein
VSLSTRAPSPDPRADGKPNDSPEDVRVGGEDAIKADSSEWTIHRGGDRALNDRLSLGDDHTADHEGVGLLGGGRTASEVIGRIARMAVEPDDEIAARAPDALVQAVRDPPVRVFEEDQIETAALGCGAETFDGPVARATVSDDHLHAALKILPSDVPRKRLDVGALVEHRGDD